MKKTLEIMKKIRGAAIPPKRIERPVKGGGYQRREKFKQAAVY